MELKPCPFCDGEGNVTGDGQWWYVECLDCGARHGYGRDGEGPDVDTWNTRPDPWTKVEEGLPEEDGTECLIALKGCICKAVWNNHYNCWDDGDGDDILCAAKEPTKWMPIPE